MHDLPFQTITQFAALGLTLIAGWFLGLASHSGGRKWRARLAEEEMDNAGYRDRAEADLRDAGRRIRELEAENARLKAAEPAAPAVPAATDAEPEGHSTATVAAAAVAGAVAGAAVTHAVQEHAAEHAEPVVQDHAEPASHAEPAAAEPVHDVPAAAEPAHDAPAHSEAAH